MKRSDEKYIAKLSQSKKSSVSFYDFFRAFGADFLTYSKAFFSFAGSILLRPLVFLVHSLLVFVRFCGSLIAKALRSEVGDDKFFTGRIARSFKAIAKTASRNPASLPSVIAYYIKRGLSQYKKLIRLAIRLLIPAAAIMLFVITVQFYGNSSIALRIDIDGKTIGYVASESEYTHARSLAKERLNLGADTSRNTADMLPAVTYTLTLININQYTGTDTLCERLIESSESNIVHACGVYINGEFLCAVKNEADAKRVFDSVLESAQPQTDENTIVSFVEAIGYVEGLYPDNADTVWDAEKLSNAVASDIESEKYYTVENGDSYASVADENNMSVSELLSLNPDFRLSKTLNTGDRLLISRSVGFLTVKLVKTVIYNEVIEYDTVEIQSDALYKGSSRVVVEGKNGAAQITSLVTYINGEETSKQEVSRLTVAEPVSKRVQVGTRALDEGADNEVSSYGGILVWPVINAFNINSDYGWRWGKIHAGLDIGSSVGTSLGKLVVAAAEGTVVISGVHSSYGYYVKIDHGNGMQTMYAHCLAGSLMVNVGDKVVAGQPIARVGMTGNATGPHLHFEVIINGSKVDPKPYLGLN